MAANTKNDGAPFPVSERMERGFLVGIALGCLVLVFGCAWLVVAFGVRVGIW